MNQAVREKHRLWRDYWRPSNWKCLVGDDNRRVCSIGRNKVPTIRDEWAQLMKFCDEMGRSERIFNTVFPLTYAFYTRIFIWIFIISITMVAADHVDKWAIVVGTLVGYIFLTTHKIGGTLLNPFDEIDSGIALDQISRTIEIDMLETCGEENLPEPIINQGKEYVM